VSHPFNGEREFSQSFHIFDLRRFFRVGGTYHQFVCPLPNCLSRITSQTEDSFLQVFAGKRFGHESLPRRGFLAHAFHVRLSDLDGE
jgi:hypothetical protein